MPKRKPDVDVGLPVPLGDYSYLPPVQTGMNDAVEEKAMNPVLAWLAGQGIDLVAEKTGVKSALRERGAAIGDGLLGVLGFNDANAADVQDKTSVQTGFEPNPPVQTGMQPTGPVIVATDAPAQPQSSSPAPVQADVALGNTPPESMTPFAYNMPANAQDVARRQIESLSAIQQYIVDEKTPPATPDDPDTDSALKSLGGLWDSTLGNEEWRLRKAMILNSMRLNPDAALTTAFAERIKDIRSSKRSSKTADYLESIGQKQAADLIRNGADPKTVLAEALKGVTPDVKDISSLRKEYTGDASTKAFSEQSQAYGRVVASAKNPSAAGDLALIFNFMKVLDPGSVVREGEFANAQNAGGVDAQVRAQYNNLLRGERLTEGQRLDFLTRSTMLYDQAASQHELVRQGYENIARMRGYNVEEAIPGLYGYTPETPEGMNQSEWKNLWNKMTAAEKAAFIAGGV